MKFLAIVPAGKDPETHTEVIGPMGDTPTHLVVEAFQKRLALVSLTTGVKYQCIDAPNMLDAIIQTAGER